ncbi:MAG: diguanylate cyclase [Planctomycetes bacterium]|nr:diguanylate cyclase [Planctomycetota bacterium]
MDALHILLALHDRDLRPELAAELRTRGIRLDVRHNILESFAATRDLRPDAVLLAPLSRDAASPEFQGLMDLSQDPEGPALVVLTDAPALLEEQGHRIDDFVSSADALEQVVRRLRFVAARRHELRRLHRERVRLERAAGTDFKTGLANDRLFDERCRVETSRAERDQRPLGVLFIDLDDFKRVNDEHDHAFGDHVLSQVAATIQAGLRPFDVAARIGGDEFAVLLPGTELRYARSIAERLRLAVMSLDLEHGGRRARVSITVGASAWMPGGDVGFDAILQGADRALLQAKRLGRNRVGVYEPDAKPSGSGAGEPETTTEAAGDADHADATRRAPPRLVSRLPRELGDPPVRD